MSLASQIVKVAYANRDLRRTLRSVLVKIAAEDLARMAEVLDEDWDYHVYEVERAKDYGVQYHTDSNAKGLKRHFQENVYHLIVRFQKYARLLVETKKVPTGMRRQFDRAVRTFLKSRRRPRNPWNWHERKGDDAKLLIEAAGWPDLGEAGDDEDVFTEGSFTIYNQVDARSSDLERIRKIIELSEKALTRTSIPGVRTILYGDVYIVGKISQTHWLAWYNIPRDKVFVRPLKGGDENPVHSLIHELGHRYWKKVVTSDQKSRWERHHKKLQRKGGRGVPEVGEELDYFKVKGMRETPVVEDIRGDKVYIKGVEGKYFPLKSILRWSKNVNFPTAYAATDLEEHFCESFALYALGRLEQEHIRPFEDILGIQGSDTLEMIDPLEEEPPVPIVTNDNLSTRYQGMIGGLQRLWSRAKQQEDKDVMSFASMASDHINRYERVKRGHGKRMKKLFAEYGIENW